MGQFIVGQVVSSNFPFSDLSSQKRRPALIVAIVDFEDLILCQITSKPYASTKAIHLKKSDFQQGELPQVSFIRPDKLFTADKVVIDKIHGTLSEPKLTEVKGSIRQMFV